MGQGPTPWPQLPLTWSRAWHEGVTPQTPENRQTRLPWLDLGGNRLLT